VICTDCIILVEDGFQLEAVELASTVRVKPEGPYYEPLRRIVEAALAVARPKAVYRAAIIEARGADTLVIDGVTFNSRLLCETLVEADQVFPYVVTGGTELEEWSAGFDDMLERYWTAAIKELAMRAALETLIADLAERYRPGPTASISPGSLPEWPITEQEPLFSLLGNVEAAVGVNLSEYCVMTPVQSLSGIRFVSSTTFESCQLCAREKCDHRRVPYDPAFRVDSAFGAGRE